jgi:hypothetical protein
MGKSINRVQRYYFIFLIAIFFLHLLIALTCIWCLNLSFPSFKYFLYLWQLNLIIMMRQAALRLTPHTLRKKNERKNFIA